MRTNSFAVAVMSLLFSWQAMAQEMSLSDILNLTVDSASNTSETLAQAPATMIVITRKDISDRGYKNVSEILDDLPGMEVSRSYGDTAIKNYMRGWRNAIGDPFLFMIDGIVMNHLYFNVVHNTITTVPLSNVKQIEVVYGPTSSVYGANAFMGVINVITNGPELAKAGETKTSYRGFLLGGELNRTIGDVTASYQGDGFNLQLTGRFDEGQLDFSNADRYEFLKEKYIEDRRIYGGFIDNPNLGGTRKSLFRNRAYDLRIYTEELEIGARHVLRDSGYGYQYPGDKVQMNGRWALSESDVYLRFTKKVSDKVTSTTMVRHRESDVPNDSYFVDGYFSSSDNEFLTAFSYWYTYNESMTVTQDFDVKLSDSFSLVTGIKWERKNLQKAYNINGEAASGEPGGYEPVSTIDAGDYLYPQVQVEGDEPQNRILTQDKGAYVQSKYKIAKGHELNLGLRSDSNSEYDSSLTKRFAYVAMMDDFIFKLIYGEAYQEPTPRALYGAWGGSGSDPSLDPENSQTIEFTATHTTSSLTHLVSFFVANNSDTIVQTSAGATNLGKRTVQGIDYHITALIPVSFFKQFKVWGYFSHLLTADEEVFDSDGVKTGDKFIGDLARNKLMFGTQVNVSDFGISLRGRHIGPRDTVSSNPVNKIDAYTTLDTKLAFHDPYNKGITWAVQVENLTDTVYDHPGTREADAGTEPGVFDDTGAYSGGSQSYFNSVMPQPGRLVYASIQYDF